ncbi:hypothetical protein TNCV_299791 [Trichonephila clavipes]|nr:hypothetical protein TNCV_299791 [Trichonephila clavipes]
MRLLITSWGILSHFSRRAALSSSWEFVGVVGGQQVVFLECPKRTLLDSCLENTLGIPFVRFLPRKGNPPPGSISNDVEVCAPVNGDATIYQHSPTAKSDTFVHERRVIPTATVPPDENTPIIRRNRKTGLVRKKNFSSFISPPVHMLCCPLPAVATMPSR